MYACRFDEEGIPAETCAGGHLPDLAFRRTVPLCGLRFLTQPHALQPRGDPGGNTIESFPSVWSASGRRSSTSTANTRPPARSWDPAANPGLNGLGLAHPVSSGPLVISNVEDAATGALPDHGETDARRRIRTTRRRGAQRRTVRPKEVQLRFFEGSSGSFGNVATSCPVTWFSATSPASLTTTPAFAFCASEVDADEAPERVVVLFGEIDPAFHRFGQQRCRDLHRPDLRRFRTPRRARAAQTDLRRETPAGFPRPLG